MGRDFLRSHKNRCVQFSLRALFLLMTVACVCLGAYMRQVREQAAAVVAIRAVGGIVIYDFEFAQGSVPLVRRPAAYGWWPLAALGDDYLFDVVSVDLQFASLCGARQADEANRQLQALPKLRELTLHESQSGDEVVCAVGKLVKLERLLMPDASKVTDSGIKCLGQLDKLRRLCLGAPRLTDEWLRTIGRLRSLEQLDLSIAMAKLGGADCLRECGAKSCVTWRGLRHLRQLTQLKALDLSCNLAVTDEWTPYFCTLKLEQLDLRRTRVTSESLRHLAHVASLWDIDLSGNPGVTDEGMRHIVTVQDLEGLSLAQTRVTSGCLGHLTKFKKLIQLDLSRNDGINDEAMNELVTLQELQTLNLADTRVTSKCLTYLGQLGKLKNLDLSGDRGIDDEGARCLAEQSSLEHLNLERTSVTRSGLEHLKRLKKLHWLTVSTADERRAAELFLDLTEALPGCFVHVVDEETSAYWSEPGKEIRRELKTGQGKRR